MRIKTKRIVFTPIMAIVFLAVLAVNIACAIFSEAITTYLFGYGIDTSNIDYESSAAVCEAIEADGAILLKNDGDGKKALPLESGEKLNVFGWSSISPAYTGGGSGSSNSLTYAKTLFDGFESAGFEYNRELESFYRSYKGGREETDYWSKTYPYLNLIEPGFSQYGLDLLNNAKAYSDTAIVVITRLGGEHQDIPKTQVKWGKAEDTSRTYLDITTEEEELLDYVGANFGKTVVIVNAINTMNLSFVERPDVDAALYVGAIGEYGALAIGKLLKGEVTPSGKTADTYVYDFSTAATYANSPDGHLSNTSRGSVHTYAGTSDYYIDYLESIYVGYKWYETADKVGFWDSSYAKDKWGLINGYDDVVQYPLGYGLSYTSFDWRIKKITPAPGSTLALGDEITMHIDVTNKGAFPGSDVVQVYYEPPYTIGGIEKSSKNLAAFVKSSVIDPGATVTVELKFKASDMKSYDFNDANRNGFIGYELEAGDYGIYISTDAHNAKAISGASFEYRIASDIKIDKDVDTGSPVDNYFTGDSALDNGVSIDGSSTEGELTYLTRSEFDASFPEVSAVSRRKTVTQARNYDIPYSAATSKPTQGFDVGLSLTVGGELNTELIYELGADYDAEIWEDLLSQIKTGELEDIVEGGGYGTAEVKSIGKPKLIDLDGPLGLNDTNMTSGSHTKFSFFPSETVLAQTWDVNLAFAYGQAVGDEAMTAGVSGWYAPGCNIHRSPFGGRNFEYYSEDATLSGKMAANTISGATAKGLYCYLKHFAANETANNGSAASVGMYTWLTEQAFREIYLRGFEIAVKEGPANAVMAAYNFIGATWCGGSYALMTKLLRDEWGFRGSVITDYSDGSVNSDPDQGLRAGTDMWLAGLHIGLSEFDDKKSATALTCMRRAAKNMLYTYCNTLYRQSRYDPTAVSNRAANKVTAYWIWWLVALDAVTLAGIGVGVYFLYLRKKKPLQNAPATGDPDGGAKTSVEFDSDTLPADMPAQSGAANSEVTHSDSVEEHPLPAETDGSDGISGKTD